MKRCIAIILFFALIIGILPYNNTYAEKNFKSDLEIITINMKKAFNITHDYENFDSGVNTYDDTIRYYLNWSDSDKEIPDINIEVDEKENIISYYKNYKGKEEDKTSSISIKEGEDLALEFIAKIGKKNAKEISKGQVNNSDPWNSFYSFVFYRQVEGVPFHSNMIQVNVDKYKKEVLNYSTSWDYDVTFPKKNGAIEIDKAREVLKDKLGLQLIYKQKHNGYPRRVDKKEFYLAYGFLNEDKVVDALSGEIINVNKYIPFIGGYGDNVKEESAEDGGLSPQEKEEIEKLSGIYTKEEIEKISRETLQLNDGYKLINSNLYSSWKNKDEFIWDLYFELDGEKYDSANISLNAKNSDIISFYKYQNHEDYKDKKAIINKDEALKIARDYLKKIVDEKIEKIEYIGDNLPRDGKNFTFNFIRKEGDIYIEDDYINIGVNAIDKDIFSYSINWYNGAIPPKGLIINKEKAYEVLFDEIGYELMYIKSYNIDKNIENPRQNKGQIKLVYDTSPNKPINIEAVSGRLLNNSGDEYIPKKEIKYIDLDNSYAKDKIKILGEYGIGFSEEKFKPKEEILQKDFVYLLWKSINPYREKIKDINKMYEELINRGIVKEEEKGPDTGITKEEGVAFIIRAMNYEEVASLKDIYKGVFIDSKDIKEEYIGHINLAYGFKIIQGDGGNPPRVNPKKKLTREDAGNIIYNYIFR